jgi:hypothetical protein
MKMAELAMFGPGYNSDWMKNAEQRPEESIFQFFIRRCQNLQYFVDNMPEASAEVRVDPKGTTPTNWPAIK